MGIKRKITLYIITVLFALCLVAALCTVKTNAFAYSDRVEITSAAGDTFKAEDISFNGNESFAYCATVNFNNGDAAALTFGETENGLWAFNIDRTGNRVKLLYFTKTEEGYSAKELLTEHFIGNAKMTQAERLMVEPKVKQVDKVYLEVQVRLNNESAYIECYADGILRFSYTDGSSSARKIDLNNDFSELKYEGGNLGYNVCNADVYFSDVQVGESSNFNYTELYRNKFHFSQFAHWNNDPNGLVYYNGYYHLFYQHNPFDSVWGDMYWGHARSTDLLHWENLPICLYPERGGADGSFGAGDGYMWSGSARIYHKGESAVIESENWFGDLSDLNEGDGAGLIIFYTRDGAKQDQMIASSDDGGLTWTKRRYIPSQGILGLGEAKTDCRDPKVFEFDDNGNKVFGMLLTGMNSDNVWFLRSYDLVDWQTAGGFKARVPLVNTEATNGVECPDIAFIEADNGEEKAVITLAGRGYIVGDLTYENDKFVFKVDGEDISQMNIESVPVKQMDFGPDSYATQTFFIEEGEYAGKTVSVSWFSGVPGASASVDNGLLTELRTKWNCGMTIPVVWGLHFDGENYILTQTPITKDNSLNKTVVASAAELKVKAGDDILKNLIATAMEIDAVINNPNGGNVAFRVRVGKNEYTEIGWNQTDGYYVDRSHTASGNLNLPNYAAKYTSGLGNKEELSFLILCDEGGLEVFCGNGAAAFYTVTFASPNSAAMSFFCETAVTVNKLKISSFASAMTNEEPKNVLRLGADNLEMDLTLCKFRDVLVYASDKVTYEIVSGKGIVTYMETIDGLRVFAERAGEAVIKATCGQGVQYISVTVHDGEPDSDCVFDNVTAGEWYVSDGGYIGYIKGGDAYNFSEREGADFIYSAQFDLRSGIAAALVFRASADLSSYVIANYDNGAGLVKLWSSAGDNVQVEKRLSDLSNIVLTVSARGSFIKVYLNRELLIEANLNEGAPEKGLFGLNVCAANVLFKAVSVTDLSEEKYSGGDIVWNHTDTSSFTVINRSLNNRLVDSGFYTVEGRKVILSQNYMASLPEAKEYILEITGQKSLYQIVIDVQNVPCALWSDVVLQENSNAVFYIGNTSAETLYINGKAVDETNYKIEGMYLTVYAKAFTQTENLIKLNDSLQAKVTVNGIPQLQPNFNDGNSKAIYISLFVIVGVVIAGEAAFIAYTVLKKGKKDGGND